MASRKGALALVDRLGFGGGPGALKFAPKSVITSLAGFAAVESVITSLAGFAGARPHAPAGRTAIPAALRYAPIVSRRMCTARSIRRSDHPRRPNAITCCLFSSFKTLLTLTEGIAPSDSTSRVMLYRWPVLGDYRGIDLDLIDKLLADYKKPEDIIGENGLLKQLTKALLERAMQAEMTEHLGYAKHDQAGNNSGNSRNGKTTKALKGDFGELPLETPRDRNGTFEPKIVAKGQTRFTGFDDKIVSMYARGMSKNSVRKFRELRYGQLGGPRRREVQRSWNLYHPSRTLSSTPRKVSLIFCPRDPPGSYVEVD